MDFKDRLKFLRKNYDVKLTQSMLAKELNHGYTVISNYENGRNEPSIKDLIKLADFFGVSIDYLVCRQNNTNVKILNDENYNAFYLLFNSFEEEEQKKIIQTLKLWKEQ